MPRTTDPAEHLNLVLIITDQERAPMHWPGGFAGERLTSRARLLRNGVDGWVPPDAGGDTRPPDFGGGRADHDAAYIGQAVSFLRERAARTDARPFCLVVSLVNPHDVLAFPRDWTADDTPDALEGDVELENLAHPDHPRHHDPAVADARARLARKLADLEARRARPLPLQEARS